jgi:hypothetical protein
MRLPSLALALTLCGVAAASCGGGSAAGGTPVSAADFPARFASDWCAMMKRCCEMSGGAADQTCEATIAAEMTVRAADAVADGAIWDPATAGQCLAGLRAADCTGTDVAKLLAMVDVCDDIWKGVVPPGGACRTYYSCAEPLVSGGATAGASCVNATCVQAVRQPVGAACSTSPMMTCNPLEAACSGGVCVALPGNGAACSGDCRSGLRCTGGMCLPLLGAGAACAVNSDCASDRCSGGKCASVLAASDDACTLP